MANVEYDGVRNVLPWKVGLINSAGKYLTAETFGFKINSSGQGLKKKQTWTLEQDIQHESVHIKSNQGRYLSVDKYGKVTCEKEDGLERCDKFVIEYATDGTGRWSFKNLEHGYYFGGVDENIQCFSRTVTDTELWSVQLAIHPQVVLRHVSRKRYAVMCDDEIHCKATIPWGQERLIIMHFSDGKFAFKTCDNRFLSKDGNLTNDIDANSLFALEMRYSVPDGFAFKDCKGYYLTSVGSTATLKRGKNKVPGKDDVFILESCPPQVCIASKTNLKLISVKQGVDLSANQLERCDKSTFQMELDKHSHKWAFRTSVDNKYLSLESFGGIQAASSTISPKTLFEVEPNDDGSVCIKASNNKYLSNKQTGSISASGDNPESKNFIIRMVNRPFLILKCDYGFVALKSDAEKAEVMCNKTCYEPTFIEALDDGYYYLKGKNNKYWTVHDDKSIHADSDTGTCKFNLQFHGQSQMTIRPVSTGKYLKGEPNSFLAKGEEVDASTIWEY